MELGKDESLRQLPKFNNRQLYAEEEQTFIINHLNLSIGQRVSSMLFSF